MAVLLLFDVEAVHSLLNSRSLADKARLQLCLYQYFMHQHGFGLHLDLNGGWESIPLCFGTPMA